MISIALDVDGVLADVITPWLVNNNKIRKPLSKQDIKNWDFWNELGINRFDFYTELSQCWKDWRSIPPTEQNLSKNVTKLSKLGTIDIVTAREKSTNTYVKDWLKFHKISFHKYVSVDDGPLKADLDYDLFIDDSPLNALQFLHKEKSTLLYSQPWNQDITDHRIRRICNLSDAVELLSV